MKSVKPIAALLVLLAAGWTAGTARAQTLTDYSALPPFLASPVPPNVLLLMDNSGSMLSRAYTIAYDPAVDFGGYFDTKKCYSYGSTRFTPTAQAKPCGPAGQWDGNFLNWAMMERLEIAKWVMMGGKCAPRVSGNCYPGGMLTFESDGAFSVTNVNVTSDVAPGAFVGTRCLQRSSNSLIIKSNGSSCGGSTLGSFTLRVEVTGEPQGVIQQVGGKARFGLMEFSTSSTADGGKVLADVGSNITSMVNAIENTAASTWTPLAESLYEAGRYFAQIKPAYANSDYSYTSQSRDPYYFTQPDWLPTSAYVPCCKSFVIIFTDGQPTKDLNLPASIATSNSGLAASAMSPVNPYGPTYTANNNSTTGHFNKCSNYFGGSGSDPCTSDGSHYLDDVAYWVHTTDLRQATIPVINEAGKDLSGKQNLIVYTFFAFGTGSNILKDASRFGGFEDLNGDGKPGPSPREWNRSWSGSANCNPYTECVPDTYFESSDAFAMKDRLIAAITDILQKSASGTSVSVLAASASGEGAVYQAYFYPSVFEAGNEVSWLGYLQGLFFDEDGQLREDTDSDGALTPTADRIVETFFDPNSQETKIRRWAVDPSTGQRTGAAEIVGLRDISPIWEAGKRLALRDLGTAPRTIKTWVDSNNNGVVDAGEFIDFSTANESTLRRYLRAADSTEGTNIINFIRGSPVSGYRPREVNVNGSVRTWRLGDIIYSSPVQVGAPQERFDLRYQDTTYAAFYNKYKNRRNVIYVGANDGMLHAFNGGFFHRGDNPATPGKQEQVWFATTGPTGTETAYPLGEELWAFIPQELLPHLKWLTQTDYTKSVHVYYVDGTPRVADVRIFTEEAACSSSGVSDPNCKHLGGWGTILIGSLRLGGGLIKADLNGDGDTLDAGEDRFRSAYFALDITDPEQPGKLLWVFKDGDLGFTTSWPAVMRFDATTWYAVFGSGPITYRGERDTSLATKFGTSVSEYGQLYVVNLANGSLVRKITLSDDRYAFMGDPVVYDLPRNYVTDVLYVGKTYYATGGSGGWRGKVYRFVLKSSDFSSYDQKVFVDPQKPVLVKPTATLDQSNRLWIYFGTGRFFSAGPASDQTDTSQQGLYAVKESGANGCWTGSGWLATCPGSPVPLSDLVDVTGAVVSEGGSLTCSTCGGGGSTLSSLVSYIGTKQGWLVTLSGGERVLHEFTIIGGIALATTYVPGTDMCAPQGTNALYAMYYESGTAYSRSVIGLYGGDKVTRKADLGVGVPSKVNVVVSNNTTTGFIQSSTGEILQVRGIQLASPVRASVRAWREKTE